MNGLKRTISLLLSTVLLFSLSGCAAEESTSQAQQAAVRWAEQEITPAQGMYQLGFCLLYTSNPDRAMEYLQKPIDMTPPRLVGDKPTITYSLRYTFII